MAALSTLQFTSPFVHKHAYCKIQFDSPSPRNSLSVSRDHSIPSALSLRSSMKSSTAFLSNSKENISLTKTNSSQGFVSPVCKIFSLSEIDSLVVKTAEGFTEFPSTAGVYAVYDKEGGLQFVGLSRKLSTSIQLHAEELPDLCHSVKVLEVAASDRSALSDAWKLVLESHLQAGGSVPPGNESGNTTWTTRKVKRVKPDFRLTPGPHVKLDVTLQELIDMVVKDNEIVVFIKGSRSAPECGFSHKVLTILNELKVNYESINVLDEKHNYGIREEIKNYSQWPTIPQVFVKGEFIGGADILEEMATSGELIKVLNQD